MRTKTILLAAVVALVALAAACGGDDDNKKTTTGDGGGTTGSPATDATKQPQQTSPTSGAASAGKLGDLLKDSSKLTYHVVYAFEMAGSNPVKGTYTLAQKPPKSLSSFDIAGQGTFATIDDGQQTYSCTKLGAQPSGICQKSGGPGAGTGISFFSLAAIAQTAGVAPDTKEIDGRKVAGRDARCFQYAPAGSSPTILCVDKQNGLMLSVETSDPASKMTIAATEIKASVDDKVFELPYKVQ